MENDLKQKLKNNKVKNIDKVMDYIKKTMKYKSLLSVYHADGFYEIDIVILNALFTG